MQQFIRIGVDLAKNYFQIHALTSEGAPATTRKLARPPDFIGASGQMLRTKRPDI